LMHSHAGAIFSGKKRSTGGAPQLLTNCGASLAGGEIQITLLEGA
jgi:hypothetical protein